MKYSLLFLLLPFFAFAGGKGEKVEKEINRQFSIQSDGVLNIQNKFGAIDITIGAANQIKMNISISVEASNTKKAQETLNRIDVVFEESANKVTAVTEIESGSFGRQGVNDGSRNIEINYTVSVPADIYLELANKYGAIYVERTNRKLKVDLSYGDIRLGDINGDLEMEMAYSEGTLSNFQNGKIKLGYSELEMEDSESVDIRMQYTDLSIRSSQSAKIDASYSDLEAGNIGAFAYLGKYADVSVDYVNSIDARSNYTDMEIGGLSESGDITMTYGELEIENISAVFSKIEIQSSYTDVSLEFQNTANFTLDAQTSYCDINHDGLDVIEHVEKGSSSKLKASKGNGGGQVLVKMTYGELEID